MKRIIRIVLVILMVFTLAIIPAIPVGAKNGNVYESFLSDNPAPDCSDILNYGKVTINSEFIAQIEILTDAIDKNYDVIIEIGGRNQRYNVNLGTITTNGKGKGEACFDLKDYKNQIFGPRVIGPYFVIKTQGKPMPEFDTSYLVFPDTPPPGPSQIIVKTNNTPLAKEWPPRPPFAAVTNEPVHIDMSYGTIPPLGYPNGVNMYDGDQIESGPLMPGIYTVTQNVGTSYNLESVDIDDPTQDSIQSGRTAVVYLAPGETVSVTFNTRMLVEASLVELDSDDQNPPIGVVGKTYFTISGDQNNELRANVIVQNGVPYLNNWDVRIMFQYYDISGNPISIVYSKNFEDILNTNDAGFGRANVWVTIDPPAGTASIDATVGISEDYFSPNVYLSFVNFNDWEY